MTAPKRRRNSSRRWTDDQLVELVPQCDSWVVLWQRIGVKGSGAVIKRVRELELDTSHFVGQDWMKGHRSTNRKPTEELLIANSPRSSHGIRLRLIRDGFKEPKCERCERTHWEGEAIPLTLHHINGIHNDNRLENLMILCYNCHALTPDWAGRGCGKSKAH